MVSVAAPRWLPTVVQIKILWPKPLWDLGGGFMNWDMASSCVFGFAGSVHRVPTPHISNAFGKCRGAAEQLGAGAVVQADELGGAGVDGQARGEFLQILLLGMGFRFQAEPLFLLS